MQLVPTEEDPPALGQQEEEVQAGAGEQEPPQEPPDKGVEHSHLATNGPQGADEQLDRRLTRSMSRKENQPRP